MSADADLIAADTLSALRHHVSVVEQGAQRVGGPSGAHDPDASVRANRAWWDSDAVTYQSEHGAFLGAADFVWCPERLREADAHLLGPVQELAGRRLLEVGAGAAMCSRWLASHGARTVALDLSEGMLREARAGNAATGIHTALVQADGRRLPFLTDSFDDAFTAFGAIPFIADPDLLLHEVARVVRPGGRWIYATTHPMRWAFPDDPGVAGLTATMSYFDRSPYLEYDETGALAYAEHHRTIGDQVRGLRRAGFCVEDIVEPEWPDDLTAEWGQWSPLRGAHFPGTAIFCCTTSSRG